MSKCWRDKWSEKDWKSLIYTYMAGLPIAVVSKTFYAETHSATQINLTTPFWNFQSGISIAVVFAQ